MEKTAPRTLAERTATLLGSIGYNNTMADDRV